MHSSLREPRAGCEGQVTAQPSARLQCPPGELVLLLQLLPWGGHLLTMPDIEEWSNSLYVSLPPPPPLLCCPLPSTQGICLVKLINLFNDAISFFHIKLSCKLATLSAFQEEWFHSWLFYLWHGDMLRVPGDSLVDFLNFQNDCTDAQMWHFGALKTDSVLKPFNKW